jgi:hypothetical protein
MISDKAFEFEQKVLKKLGMKYLGLRICELGNQTARNTSAKYIYGGWGALHVSIDINGSDGSLQLDLAKDIPTELNGIFDLVTNHGTLEHVDNQYMAFNNAHHLCKLNGVILHMMPLEGHWPLHSRYYYNTKIMSRMAEVCSYEVVDNMEFNNGWGWNIASVFIKTQNTFPPEKTFSNIGIVDVNLGEDQVQQYKNRLEFALKGKDPWYKGLKGNWWWGMNKDEYIAESIERYRRGIKQEGIDI